MRHLRKQVKLGRKRGPRKALLSNLAASMILYEKVTTTEAKAKAIGPIVEKLITKGKSNTLTTKRALDKALPDKKAAKKILEVLGPRYKERNGGYTRIIKVRRRQGDGAPMVIIEFV